MAVKRWTDEMLDKLAELAKENSEFIKQNSEYIKENSEYIKQLREESKEMNIRFSAYQQASQWVVNLAFGLLATATITTIITAVFRK
jgi:predicted nuclease with TOPRIM domain